MNGPEGEKYDKRKEIGPWEVAFYDKPWWLEAHSLPGTPRGYQEQNKIEQTSNQQQQKQQQQQQQHPHPPIHIHTCSQTMHTHSHVLTYARTHARTHNTHFYWLHRNAWIILSRHLQCLSVRSRPSIENGHAWMILSSFARKCSFVSFNQHP